MLSPPETQIAQARRHVESGRRIIAAQMALVGQMTASGLDASMASNLLASFRRTQAVFEDDLERLRQNVP